MPKLPTRDIITYYEEAGSGPPLLLITGLGSDLQLWAILAPSLARHYRVVMYDNRGAGRTSAPDRPYSIPQMAQDAVALLDTLGIQKAHVLGLSMGGYIAQELVLAHPERVEKLVLVATAPSIDGFGRNIVRAMIDIRRSNMSREQIVRATAPLIYSPELQDDEERYERAIAAAVSNPYPQQDHAFIRQAQAILGFDAAARLGQVKHPTLVLCGKDDALVPPRNSEKLAKLIPGATLRLLSGGHVGIVEYPHEYGSAITEFLGS